MFNESLDLPIVFGWASSIKDMAQTGKFKFCVKIDTKNPNNNNNNNNIDSIRI